MSTPSSHPLSVLAGQTLARVREALHTSEAASVAQVIQLIREIADKGDSMPVQQLAEIIARDLTTMSKVLRVANTLGYNPEGIEVTTITQAINLIGFEKIRNLAVSILLMENAEGKVLAPESRDVAGLAVASGLVAQSVAEQLGMLDPEQSFVCAALRNYGKLLLTTFLLDEFRQACRLNSGSDPDAGFREVFGLTPLELGYEILHGAQLPRRLLRCLQVVPPDRLSSSARVSPDDQLAVLAEFSVKLCEAVQAADVTPGLFERSSANLVARYGRALSLGGKELPQIFKAVDRMLTAFGVVQGVRVFTSPLMKNIGAIAAGGEPGAAPPGPAAKAAAVQPRAKEILLAGLSEVAQLVAAQPVEIERVLVATARCVQASLQLTHCVVFLKEASGPLFVARAGSGTLFEQVRGRPLLDAGHTDVFSPALSRGEDVLIQSTNDPRMASSIPTWLKAAGHNRTLILLPIRDEEGTFALIVGVSELLLPLELAVQLKQQLKLLRGHVAIARGVS